MLEDLVKAWETLSSFGRKLLDRVLAILRVPPSAPTRTRPGVERSMDEPPPSGTQAAASGPGPSPGSPDEVDHDLVVLLRVEPQGLVAQAYLGACRVLRDESNPDAVALAAHGLREVIEKLPRSFDVPVEAKGYDLNGQVQTLREQWTPMEDDIRSQNAGSWGSVVTPRLRKGLTTVSNFCKDHAVARPSNREGFDRWNTRHGTEGPVASFEEWRDVDRFFKFTAHHRDHDGVLRVTLDDVRAKKARLEEILKRRLQLKPSIAMDQIDRLIAEAEGQAGGQ
jgi:hypothetical protein